jgi:protocatechuate 3,4-dioxygenase beta subunit
MMRIATLFALVLVLGASAAAAQSATPPTTAAAQPIVLRGVIRDAENSAALRAARVTATFGTARGVVIRSNDDGAVSTAVSATFEPLRTAVVMSDGNGIFSLPVPGDLPLSITVIKAGYASPTLRVPVEQARDGALLEVRLARAAVIVGRLPDIGGERPDVSTLLLGAVSADGKRLPESAAAILVDERGEFRVGGLTAGRYVIEGFAGSSAGAYRVAPLPVDVQAGVEMAVNVAFDRAEPLQITGPTPGGLVIRPAGTPLDPPPAAGGSVRGRVLTVAGEPVAGATVEARRSGFGRTGRTDASGRFAVQGLTPGSYTVRAYKRGFVGSEHGQRGDDLPAAPVVVEADKDIEGITIALPRASVVTGTVVDEHGEPLQDVGVHLLRVRSSSTGLVAIRDQGTFAQRTDDRGQFRLANVDVGDYVVSASLPSETVDGSAGSRMAYAPVYFPEALDFNAATPLRVGRAEELHGVFITMRRVPVARVAGTILNSEGSPFSGTVRLTARQSPVVLSEARVVHPDPNGAFAFDNVTMGEYLLQALVGSGPSGPEFATRALTIADRDPDPIVLRTSSGSSLRGRFVLEGDADGTMWGYTASAVPDERAWTPGSVSNLGSPIRNGEAFALNGLAGPARLHVASEDENWYLKSIVIDGFDVADRPFDFGFGGRLYADVDVTFSRLGASITGTATDERATPVRDYAVYIFPTDRDGWFPTSRRVKLARAGADGSFRVRALPPGDYWIAAVGRIEPGQRAGDWDPDLFDALSTRAVRVTVGESEARTLTLRLVNR